MMILAQSEVNVEVAKDRMSFSKAKPDGLALRFFLHRLHKVRKDWSNDKSNM